MRTAMSPRQGMCQTVDNALSPFIVSAKWEYGYVPGPKLSGK